MSFPWPLQSLQRVRFNRYLFPPRLFSIFVVVKVGSKSLRSNVFMGFLKLRKPLEKAHDVLHTVQGNLEGRHAGLALRGHTWSVKSDTSRRIFVGSGDRALSTTRPFEKNNDAGAVFRSFRPEPARR